VQIVPGLIEEPAWPTLRARLLLLAGHGTDPVAQLAAAAGRRELNDDRAAVLDWRLDDTGHRNAAPGPLPWLPGIPQALRDHPEWGNYLTARSDLVRTLADQVRATITDTDPPVWVNATRQCAAEQRRRGCVGVAGRGAGQPGGRASHGPRAASEGGPDLAGASRPSGGRRPGTGPGGMGLADRPAEAIAALQTASDVAVP
jgi:hypothetical protein